jgi:hypothetical protein
VKTALLTALAIILTGATFIDAQTPQQEGFKRGRTIL